MLKLNIGSFTTMFHGWRNSDILPMHDWARANGFTFSQWSIEQPIPYDDGVVDLIFSCHVLEHVGYDTGQAFLAECHRVLKPGGTLRLLVPDTEALTRKYLDRTIGEFDVWSDTAKARGTPAGKLWEVLCEGGHRALYDAETLFAALYRAGFVDTYRPKFGESRSPVMQAETKDLYPGLSLIVEATK